MNKTKIIMPIHWPIWFQILSILMVCFITINFIGGKAFRYFEEPELRTLLKEKYFNDYWLLHAAVTEAVISEDIPLIESFSTKVMASDKNIIFLEIKNEDGVSLVKDTTNHGVDQVYVMRFSGDFNLEGETFGSMAIIWDLHSIYDDSGEYSTRTQAVIFTALAAFTMLILILLHWVLIKPVRKIHKRLGEISRGELMGNLSLSLSASSELVRLAGSVNELSETLVKKNNYEREIIMTKQVVEFLSKQNESILNSAGEGICGLDKKGRLTFANPAAESMIGWNQEGLLGKDLCDLVHYKRKDGYVCPKTEHAIYLVCVDGIGSRVEDEIFQRKDGSDFPVEYTCTPIIEDNEPDGAVVIFKDISERVRNDKALHKAMIQIKQANKAKSEFLAVMSHEIRTPLNAIIGASNLLLETSLKDEQKLFAETAASSGQMLLALINDILDYSKLEEGKMVLEKSDFNIAFLVNETCELFRIDAAKKNITMQTLISPNVPDFVNGDSGRIRQVLLNLVSNAVKFTKSGSIKVIVELESQLDDRLLISIKVEDTGIGIPKKVQSMLFDKFSQVDATFARKYGGSGLGLAIVRNIAKLMDGDIQCESVEGTGSTFTVNLKLWEAVDEAGNCDVENNISDNLIDKKQNDSAVLKSGRILLVEDSMANQVIAMAYLNKSGYTVDAVAEGNEALTALNTRPYDIVLMDLSMPGMDGFEATKIIRNMEGEISRIPIIAMTANAMQGDKEACLQAGMNDYLSKPVDKDVLLNKVSQWLLLKAEKKNSASESNAHEVLDYFVLQQLEKDTSATITKKIINVFIKETHKRIKRITEACSQEDYSIIEQEVHVLKSSAGTYGVLKLRQIAMQLDAAFRSQQYNDILEMSLTLVDVAYQSLNKLTDYVANESN